MELKAVLNKKKIKYPEISEMNKKSVANNAPNKWKTTGISTVIISLFNLNSVFAFSGDFPPIEIAGGLTYLKDNPYYHMLEVTYGISFFITLLALILGVIDFIRVRIKLKKAEDNVQIKKKYKIFLVIALITFLLCVFLHLVISSGIISRYAGYGTY